MNLTLYRILLFIFQPFIYIYILIRKYRGFEDKNRINERFGNTDIKRPDGNLIWINAVSIGEINSVWSIIKRINETNDYNILITTTSVSSAENVLKRIDKLPNKDRVIHQFAPIDLTRVIKKFLNHWKPNILVNVESEFWPNLFTLTKSVCPIIVLNGKMSKKSFRFWYKAKKLKESIFDSIDICLAQSRNDYKRFINLGVQNVQFLGNIKFFVDRCSINEELYDYLAEKIKDRKTWLVNCTHEGEEEIIIDTHKMLKQKYTNLLTMLVIRHPNRAIEVGELLNKNKLKYITTTSKKELTNDIDFYIYDKFGDLGTFLELNDIVFMGGSLKKNIGGHNPAEAIKHNCCIITGPYIENNYMLFKDLTNINGCIVLNNNKSKTIFSTVDELFENEEKMKNIIDNSYRKSLQSSIVLDQIISIIKDKMS